LVRGQPSPHILVEVDVDLTWHLYRGCEVKPIVLSPDPLGSRLQSELLYPDDPEKECARLYTIEPLELIDVLLKHKQDSGHVGDLRDVLKFARSHFGLREDENLVTAVAGTHTSAYGSSFIGYMQGGLDIDRLHHSFAEGLRSRRTLAGLFGLALDRLEGIELAWLADVFPSLSPKGYGGLVDDSYVDLAARARADLLAIGWDHVPGIPLKRPTLPQIYVRNGPKVGWRAFENGATRRRLASTTDALISQFAQAKRQQPGLQGVLVKVVIGDITAHNAVDPPLIGARTLALAGKAGLAAILLDSRVGVIRPCDVVEPLHPPVFAV
jgi:hypothetical protein